MLLFLIFFRNETYVRRAIKMGVISTPKTASSTRYIDIIDPLLPYLKNQFYHTRHTFATVMLENGEDIL